MTSQGFDLSVVNGGPDVVTVAQVAVDDAYWHFTASPSATIPRLGRSQIFLDYPWVQAEPNTIRLITSTGLTFEAQVPLAVETPTPDWSQFLRYGLVGIYVGIVPVALGLLWYPALRRLGRRGLGAVLALTIGLLVFLLIDTLLEGLDVAAELASVFQGISLLVFAALLTWLVLVVVSNRRPDSAGGSPRGAYLATLIALGIGLHNLGEGMAIGAAFALGEAALGSFLVLGFTLHNVTEGIGIAAPLTSGASDEAVATPRADVRRPGASGWRSGHSGNMDRRIRLQPCVGRPLSRDRRRGHLASDRRSGATAPGVRSKGRRLADLMAQPPRLQPRVGRDVFHSVVGEGLTPERPGRFWPRLGAPA